MAGRGAVHTSADRAASGWQVGPSTRKGDDDWTERAWVVRSGGGVAGFLMADVDVELDRVWWMGPFAESESASRSDWSAIASSFDWSAVASSFDWSAVASRFDWSAIADVLYACGRERIAVTGEELAGDDRHVELSAFARRHGFRSEEASAVLRCTTPPALPGPARATALNVAEMATGDRDAVAALHDLLFPGTHTTGRRLVGKTDDRFHCLVGAMAGRSAGPDLRPNCDASAKWRALRSQFELTSAVPTSTANPCRGPAARIPSTDEQHHHSGDSPDGVDR